MRIVSLEPFLTETTDYFGLSSDLVGVSHRCSYPESIQNLPRLTREEGGTAAEDDDLVLCDAGVVLIDDLAKLNPDLVLVSTLKHPTSGARIQQALEPVVGHPVKIVAAEIVTLENMYQSFDELGKALNRPTEGHQLSQRIKAQLMDWSANFNDRLRGKKVTVLSSVMPPRVAGRWLPDLVRIASCHPQHMPGSDEDLLLNWMEIESFRPDVIVVAPIDYTLEQSLKTFKLLEKVPQWENIPAVKRGEVIFCDGITLYRPGPRFLQGAAILISAIAGLESGYITPRESFYRLRWLELNRHKI